jgi:hypothetical protein
MSIFGVKVNNTAALGGTGGNDRTLFSDREKESDEEK